MSFVFTEDPTFQVRASHEPFSFPISTTPSTLGELRHTKDRLRLDLSRGEASLLDDDPHDKFTLASRPTELRLHAPPKLDSGVGSSTGTSANASPFFAEDEEAVNPLPNRHRNNNANTQKIANDDDDAGEAAA
jgi:hypothetical protein